MTMLTATEMSALTGRHAILETSQERLRVECIIRDVKNSYGQVRCAIVPVAGEARPAWINFDRLELLAPVVTTKGARPRCQCHPGATHAPSRCPVKEERA
jgi:hypothetical protein